MRKNKIIYAVFITAAIMMAASACNQNEQSKTTEETDIVQEAEDSNNSEDEISAGEDETEMPIEADAGEETTAASVNGMRPEFRQAMDSYEEIMNEYCDFMKKYAESDGTDVGLLADYAEYMSKYADALEDFEAWDDEEMNSEEAAYYFEVQSRINARLLEVAE